MVNPIKCRKLCTLVHICFIGCPLYFSFVHFGASLQLSNVHHAVLLLMPNYEWVYVVKLGTHHLHSSIQSGCTSCGVDFVSRQFVGMGCPIGNTSAAFLYTWWPALLENFLDLNGLFYVMCICQSYTRLLFCLL